MGTIARSFNIPQASSNFCLNLNTSTWLIHISVLPSNWNLIKNFAVTGQLGQVHTIKKIFLIFLHGYGKMVIFVTEFVIFLKTSK